MCGLVSISERVMISRVLKYNPCAKSMAVVSSGDVPISPTGMDSDHCDNRAKDGSQIRQRSQSRAVRFSEPAVRYSEVLVFLWMSCRSTKNLGMVVHCGLHCPGHKSSARIV